MVDLRLIPMTETFCEVLGKKLCEADLVDCAAHDYDGVAALKDAWMGGPCAGVFDGNTIIGALGWTYEGFIWSLWADLTQEQAKALMKRTPEMIREMAADARRPLCNVVWDGNKRTLAWLRASHCFDFLATKHEYKGRQWVPFFVKPLGELAHV